MSTVHNRDKVKVDIEAEIGRIVVNVGTMQGCARMQNVVKILQSLEMTHDPPKVTAGCLVYFVQEWNVNKFKDTFTM